jgi:hypothetical protein
MADDKKKVFLSYRRALSLDLAGRVADHLEANGYEVFFDISSIPSGRFGDIILHQIEARPLFVPVLVPGCFERAHAREDWFRREIEHALAKSRHIVPLAAKGFSFSGERGRLKRGKLPGRLEELEAYHYIEVPDTYFKPAMQKLMEGLTAMATDIEISATPVEERQAVQRFLNAVKVAKPDAAGTKWILPSGFQPSPLALPAPTLIEETTRLGSIGMRTFRWTFVAGASGYVLEKSIDSSFGLPWVVYDGQETNHHSDPFDSQSWSWATAFYYRVKAKEVLGFDSPWSNVIKVERQSETMSHFFELPYLQQLEAPTLKLLGGQRLQWTAILGAAGYVLEKASDSSFSMPEEIYTGTEIKYTHLFSYLFGSTYYRVKAKGTLGLLDSLWSNVVHSAGFKSK